MTFRWQGTTYDTADMQRFDTDNSVIPCLYLTSDRKRVFVVRVDRMEGVEVHLADADEVKSLAERYSIPELLQLVDENSEVGARRRTVSNWRALIVEDDGITRHLLSRLLNRLGWEISCAATIAEARAALSRQPGYLILDLNLPDGIGTSLLRYVRERNLPIRIAVTTGSDDPDLMSSVQDLLPDIIFRKPTDFSHLLSWMDAA